MEMMQVVQLMEFMNLSNNFSKFFYVNVHYYNT